jgi:hypothetical protein
VLLVILAIGALGLYGIALARQGLRTQTRANARAVAFYAAETGIIEGMENWTAPSTPAPGSTWSLASGTLPRDASYTVQATQLDDGSSDQALYMIRSVGTMGSLASQTVGLLVRTYPVENPFRSALRVRDQAVATGNTDIIGNDTIPPVWSGDFCGGNGDDRPGIIITDEDDLSTSGSSTVEGNPDVQEEADTTGFFDFGDLPLGDVIASADITLPGGTVMSGSNPSPSFSGGVCDTSDPDNWGDPENTSDCTDWFPTIYVDGDLSLEGNRAGQGMLIVEGDLRAKGGFRFYGPVIVKGSLIAEGGFTFYGGVLASQTDLSSGNSNIHYSACVLSRVLSRSAAARPRPVPDRAWFSGR